MRKATKNIKTAKTRSSTPEGLRDLMLAYSADHALPPNIHLPKDAMVYWDAIMCHRRPDDWTLQDKALAAELANLLMELDNARRGIYLVFQPFELPTWETASAKPVAYPEPKKVNGPPYDASDKALLACKYMRHLLIHPTATQGDGFHQKDQATEARRRAYEERLRQTGGVVAAPDAADALESLGSLLGPTH